jgi:hypothetical protein
VSFASVPGASSCRGRRPAAGSPAHGHAHKAQGHRPCMDHGGAHVRQAPASALALAVRSTRQRGNAHGSGVRGLGALCTNAPRPNCRLETQPSRLPQTTLVQRRASSWQNAAQREPRWTPTPAAARCTAPHARPSWPWRSAPGYHPLLAGLGRRDQLAPRHPVRQRVRGPCHRPGVSPTPLQTPFFGLQVALQRGASLL